MQLRVPKSPSLGRIARLPIVGAAMVALACGGATSTAPAWSPVSSGDKALAISLSPAEEESLWAGETIEKPMIVQRGGRRYVGGVAYQLIEAPAANIYAGLRDERAIARILPKTKQVTVLPHHGNSWRAELRQGNRWLDVTYTVVFLESPPATASSGEPLREVQFWLEPAFPHDIDDVWGFFAIEEIDEERSLVSIGALVDLGPGFGRFFEGRVQKLILSTPRNIHRYFESSRLAQAD